MTIPPAAQEPRRLLLEIFDAALRAVDGRRVTRAALQGLTRTPVSLVAIGKAAPAMTLGAHDALADAIASSLVITKDGHATAGLASLARTTILESAHPVPDARSLAAGAFLVAHLDALPTGTLPVFLVSGGASSVVEHLLPGVTLEALRALNLQGLAAGWSIERLNASRAALSALKGGGVARRLAGREALALFISDVPGDDPDVIGSGLLGGDAGRADRVERRVVASVDHAVRAAVEAGAARGLTLAPARRRFDGDAVAVAQAFIDELRTTAADGIVWGGESTVKLPANAGHGGRNSHVALVVARLLRAGERFIVLAAGTDGTDGPTEDAGAIVDAGALERAELGGCDVERALREFDSGVALAAAEDLVHTGPTGTNVGDLLIGLSNRGMRAGVL